MPAKSKQQQKFMGMVHALNKGEIKPSDVSKSVKDVAKTIKKSDAEDFASTKHSGLPKKVKEQILNALKEYANKMAGNKLGGSGSYGYAPQKGLRDDDGYEDEGPKDESVNEAKFYVTRNLGRGQGKSLVGGYDLKKDKKLPPKEFRTFKDAEKYIKKISRGGSMAGQMTAYFVTDKDMNMVDKNGKRKRMFEGMFSTIDQIRQDSKDVRDFVKNVFKDRDFIKMKNDKEFIKYLKSIYESKGVPQNYMQGRTSDYHTALRGKNRDYSGGTNFKKTNHGQPDIENDEDDQETNSLSVKQTPVKEYGQRLDLSYLEDEEAMLKGTPKPKDAIDRDIEEYLGGSYEYTKGDQYGQNSVNEVGVFPIQNYLKGIIPSGRLDIKNDRDKEKVQSLLKDLIGTLNHFWKSHKIPFRVREPRKSDMNKFKAKSKRY
tara:strand:+ start:1403 stop:2692 length:1290 start_codon:yes stop_codon:yes gene_type:complete